MLQYDPNERISPHYAVRHPFLKSSKNAMEAESDNTGVNKQSSFVSFHNLSRNSKTKFLNMFDKGRTSLILIPYDNKFDSA